MVNLLQSQSTVSHPSWMQVYVGANCHAFWDKNLCYALFVRTTSVHVECGSPFSVDGIVMLSIIFTGSLTLH